MNKGSLKKIFTLETTHRIPKVATLALTTAMLVSMIAIDASASPNATLVSGSVRNTSVFASESSLDQLRSLGHHHVNPVTSEPTTTTTTPASPVVGGGTTTSGGGGGGGGTPTTTTTTPAPTTTTTTTPPPPPPPTTPTPAPTTTTTTAPPVTQATAYPVGTSNGAAVSNYNPPSATAMSGSSQSNVTTF